MENKSNAKILATVAIITTAIACLSMLPTMQASALIVHNHGGFHGGFHHGGGHGFGGFHGGFNNWGGWGFHGGNICFSDAPYWVLANHGCFFNDWF